MNPTPIARSPILAVCAALALSAAASAGSTTITLWPSSPEDDDRDGKAVLVTDLLKVDVRSKTDDKHDFDALTYVTRLHWDSTMLELVPQKWAGGCKNGKPPLNEYRWPEDLPASECLVASGPQHCTITVNEIQSDAEEWPKNVAEPEEDGCPEIQVHSDWVADFDGDPATDTYVELYWDDAWNRRWSPLDNGVLFPYSGPQKRGEWLFHARFQPVHKTDHRGHILPEYALGGKSTTLRTSGAVFPCPDDAGGDCSPAGEISVDSGELEITMPKIKPYVRLGQPTKFGLKASPDHKILGTEFEAGIDLGADLDPAGDEYPVCKLVLRWFWNSKAMQQPPAKPGSRCYPTSALGYGFDAPEVKKDSRNLDRDPRTDRYCEAALLGDKGSAELWKGGQVASLKLATGTGFKTAEVRTQIAYDDMCEQDGYHHRRYTLDAPETIYVREPRAAWDLYATSPPDRDVEACVKEPCAVVEVQDVRWRFSSRYRYSDPEIVDLYFFFNSHKLDATFTDAPAPAAKWTARKSVADDRDGTDGHPTDHDPFTDKYFKVELTRKQDRCSGLDCDIPKERLLESMPFRLTPGFEFGKTQIHLVGVARTMDSQESPGYVALAAPEHPALAIHGPHDHAYVYPDSSSTDYLTMVGPKNVKKHPHGPWFLGFTDKSKELGFQQVLAVSGPLTADGQAPSNNTDVKDAEKLTFEGLIQADVLKDGGASARYAKLACGKFTLDVGNRDLLIEKIESSSHCPDPNRVTSHLSFGDKTAGVGVGRIELVKAPRAGLKVGGSFWAGKNKTTLIAHRDSLVTIDAEETNLGIGKELKFQPPEKTQLKVGLMDFELPGSEMKATYDVAEDKLTLTGKVKIMAWDLGGPVMELDFSKPFDPSLLKGSCDMLFQAAKGEFEAAPGIVFHDGAVSAVGRVGISTGDVKIHDLNIKSLNFLFDTVDNFYLGCGDLTLPVKKSGNAEGEAGSIDVLAGIGFDDGSLDSLLIGVENANIQMGDTGLYFQDLDLAATDLDNSDEVKFQGTTRFTLGEDVTIKLPSFLGGNRSGALGTFIAHGEFTKYGLKMKGASYMLGKMIKQNEAGVAINWGGDEKHYVRVEVHQRFLNGAFRLSERGSFAWSPWRFGIHGDASVNVPDFIPIIGGKSLGDGAAQVSYNASHNDGYLGFSGEIGVWKFKKTLGLEVDFKGGWDIIHHSVDAGYVLVADSGAATVTFPLQAGEPAVIGARWQNLVGSGVTWALNSPDGTIYDPGSGAVQWHSADSQCGDEAKVCIDAIHNAPTELLLIIPEPVKGTWQLSVDKTGGHGDLGDLTADLCHLEIAQNETIGTLDKGVCFAAFQSQDERLQAIETKVAYRSSGGGDPSATTAAARR